MSINIPIYDEGKGDFLFGNEICPYCQRVQLALLESPSVFQYKTITFSNKPEWFSAASPLGKIPLMITEQGVIFESDIIIDFLDRKYDFYLSCDNDFERTKLMMWVRLVDHTQDLLRQYFLSLTEKEYADTAVRIIESFKLLYGNDSKIKFIGEYYPWIDVFLQPLLYLTDILSAFGGTSLLNDEILSQHRGALESNPNMREVFNQSVRDKLLDFLLRNETVFASHASEIISL